MYMSVNTVKTYIRTAYRKMGVDSRTRAVLWGIDHGFRPDNIAAKAPDRCSLVMRGRARSHSAILPLDLARTSPDSGDERDQPGPGDWRTSSAARHPHIG